MIINIYMYIHIHIHILYAIEHRLNIYIGNSFGDTHMSVDGYVGRCACM